jgi:hypothetical protein
MAENATIDPKPAAAAAPAATPAAPAPAAAPAAPAAEPSGEDPNPFAEVDAPFLAAIEKVDGPPKGAAAAPAADKGKTTPKAGAAAAPAAAPGRTTQPAEFRKQYEANKIELDTIKTKYSDLEKKIAEHEAKGKGTEVMRERLAQMEKDHAQIQAELRMFKQEASPEFRAKYDEPFDAAAEVAKSQIRQLEVIVDPDTGEVRPANFDNDFAPIYRMPLGQAIKKAKEMFGDASGLVIQHLTELKRLDEIRGNALRAEKEHAAERMKQEEGQRLSMRQREEHLRERVISELADKNEDYRDDPADKEAVEARRKALAIYDTQAQDARLRIVKEAHVRHRVGAYSVMQLKLARANARIRELEGAKAEEREDLTGRSARPGGNAPAAGATKNWEQDLRESVTP